MKRIPNLTMNLKGSLDTQLVYKALLPAILLSALSLATPASGQSLQRPNAGQMAASRGVAIVGGSLIDGSGSPPVPDAVVLIEGNRIAAAGTRRSVKIPKGARIINARGQTVTPGFIDMHNHSGGGLNTDGGATTQVSQGITTVVLGQDGGSEFPIAEHFARLEKSPVAVNVVTFVGHATVRVKVMGKKTNRAATAAEIERMQKLVEQAMREGARGLSTGLEYEVGKPATTEEVVALARVAGRFGGIYISHIRDEADDMMKALAEAIRIGEEAHLPVHISHIKLGSQAVWGLAAEAVEIINQARQRGVDVTADCYPYSAWSSGIKVLVPSGRHDNPADVAKGLADVGGAANVTITSFRQHPEYEFKTLAAIAQDRGVTPDELYMWIVREGGAGVVCHAMRDEDIRTFYQTPWVMVGSDGGIGMRHPRSAGAFPRVLGRYVREQRWLTLEEAIHKMTALPAARLEMKDRGLVRAGMKADLVLFDPTRVIDRSTFAEPALLSEHINLVFVNGVEVWRDGRITGRKPGIVLRHNRAE